MELPPSVYYIHGKAQFRKELIVGNDSELKAMSALSIRILILLVRGMGVCIQLLVKATSVCV